MENTQNKPKPAQAQPATTTPIAPPKQEPDKPSPEKNPVGRPSLFREKYIEQAYKLTLLGATDAEMADFFGVVESTIYLWKIEFPEFSETIKKGKIKADAEVAESLYHRAKGCSHPEDKVFLHEGKPVIVPGVKYYPPDTGAAMAWLKNRRPKDFRDTHDFTSGGEKITPQIVSFADATKPTPQESKPENDNPK